MTSTYSITGMTCNGCVASVTKKLETLPGVEQVQVDLERQEAIIISEAFYNVKELEQVLPSKYTIGLIQGDEHLVKSKKEVLEGNQSRWVQLRPLFLIFLYLCGAAILLNYKEWSTNEAMLDFMGLFYIVFSFFKFLDLKGFPESFKMYDPLAKAMPMYGWVYPFIELALGLLFLMRVQLLIAMVATIVVLGITTFGVTKTLLDKKSIRCACLGTALKLPMTEATFIENAIMLLMAVSMLLSMF
ncbi:Hypothetical protein I595_1064 [Croceitalea dokdonensis DOKDO 023]|uniref:HMA domain-containing protein n=1 Tax=Croceitalea dokdonensis DOKDO 023 TaxID=1300341 RepID=A0A0P7AX66_9FLAO|nr:heavy metal-associated domain-containing protein [Croceitalea dokdonensis]KPM32638.1 Hypothetical protein I595_1064 [Croceitalea dokdonensis DOKDO 023]